MVARVLAFRRLGPIAMVEAEQDKTVQIIQVRADPTVEVQIRHRLRKIPVEEVLVVGEEQLIRCLALMGLY
jgi:hypothetical protein